ncbi:MAG: SDR family NAD(P)-dependent oxidoreductase [Spirirestis rafaelensis WJT71-NPBG6]|jgi:acyl transferase domain-containing protein/acyl carrier protein|nr:SDR family NAD(P)-dependent oxidoreductase [Spirirestis rafaelensis WJT71-NPBG6]
MVEPVAIIGVSCRFPKAKDKDAFWNLLRNGVDAISEVPPERSHLRSFYHPNPKEPGKMSARWGGFLEQIDQFDAHFFGTPKREAAAMDPQQRLLLETAWEALEDAGIAPERLSGSRTGVFIGVMWNDYAQMQTRNPSGIDAYTGSGNGFFMTANRLSYRFNFQGPSLAVDTGCSSSLVAVHLACQSLYSGESSMALAGGVNIILEPGASIFYTKAGLLAADGRCKSFDGRADGIVRGEGVGVVVLKLLSQALADGDPVYAIIRGNAVNQDGLTNGVTAPSQRAQEALLREVYQKAGVCPSQVQYVETHGTGTLLGDPIEAKALGAVMSIGRPAANPCAIGSVKTNIGHLEGAAGIAAVIKVALALKHQEIPPSLHFQESNPHIPFDNLPLRVQHTLGSWSAKSGLALAGVSSFGLGGTNAHIILQEALPVSTVANYIDRPLHLLTLSAKTENALVALAVRYGAFLANNPNLSLADICFTANTGRSHFAHRLAVAAESTEILRQHLYAFAGRKSSAAVTQGQVQSRKKPKIAFLFTGQGSQYPGMARQLYDTQPTFRQALDRCDQLLRPYLEQPLLQVIYPESETTSPLNQTAYTQPALFALEYALAQMWRSWGVEPQVVMGHSLGEYVAACIAGVFSLEDALKLVAQRARLMQSLPAGGEMAVVFTTEERVLAAISPYAEKIAIAAINGPENIVISGAGEAVQAVLRYMVSEGVKTTQLNVSHAFHSPLMEPILDEFEQTAELVKYASPCIPLISNLTGELIAPEDITSPNYWRRHLRGAVRFYQGIETLHQQGYEIFVELGPSPILAGMGRRCLPEGTAVWLSSLKKGQPDWQQSLECLRTLYVRGVEINWSGFDRDYVRRRMSLPTYPFQQESFWTPVETVATNDLFEQVVIEEKQQVEALAACSPEWFYQWQWHPEQLVTLQEIPPGAILILSDRQNLGKTLMGMFAAEKHTVYFVTPDLKFQKSSERNFTIDYANPDDYEKVLKAVQEDGLKVTAVIHLWNYSSVALKESDSNKNSAPLVEDQNLHEGVYSVLFLSQALLKVYPHHPIRLFLVTQNAYATRPGEAICGLHQSMAATLAQVLDEENPTIETQVVDVTSEISAPEKLANIIFQQLKAKPCAEGIVALRNGQRLVRTLEKISLSSCPNNLRLLKSGETCLITGGTSAVGTEIALSLASQAPINLVLTGRHPLPPKEQWGNVADSATKQRIQAIAELERLGATVMYQTVDVNDVEGMQRLVSNIKARFGKLDAVIHAAGVSGTTFMLKTEEPETFAKVLAPKVQGTIILDAVTQNEPLKFFIVLSSVAASKAKWGAGIGDYAVANTFLDSYAVYRSQRNTTGKSLAINYSLWRDRGMGAILGESASLIAKSKGLNPLEPEQAVNAFLTAVSSDTPSVVHIIDLIAETTAQVQTPSSVPEKNLVEDIFTNQSQSQSLRFLIREILCQYLSVSQEQLEGHKTFQELGMDSIGVIEAIKQLSEVVKDELFPTLLFEYQTPDDLADYLERKYGDSITIEPQTPATSVDVAKPNFEDTKKPDIKQINVPQPNFEDTKKPDIKQINFPQANSEDTKKSDTKQIDVKQQDIAIIGMACKVPGANNLEEYWNLLVEGKCAIQEVPKDRWSIDDYYQENGTNPHTTYCNRGGFIERPFDFDTMFFGVSPREASAMDPQQRLFLEIAWQALQQAGYGGRYRPEEIGVFVGCGQNNYAEHFLNSQQYEVLRERLQESSWYNSLSWEARKHLQKTLIEVLQPSEILPETAAGNELNGIAARVSHCLNLTGPSLTVGTACSSSLVALHLGCESLRSGQSRMVIVGGVNLNLSSTPFTLLSRVQALSPTGDCYPFDRRANGMVLGEGAGAVILKPLQQAIEDGDFIYAVIKGSAVNNDGHSQGITAPNPRGQAEAIRKAYINSGINPEDISYIETHGTGTLLGDPVEIEGMTQAFRSFTDRREFCAISSVKSSIGHMLSASGIVSLIKVALAMQHGRIPGTFGYEDPNPHINFAATPFYVAGSQGVDWSGNGKLLRAGVNGFGFGGTNCHVILEQSPVASTFKFKDHNSTSNMLFLTGRTQTALKEVAQLLHNHLIKHPEHDAAQVCFTMNNAQRDLPYKAALLVGDRQQMLDALGNIMLGEMSQDVCIGKANPQRSTPIQLVMDGSSRLSLDDVKVLGEHFPDFQTAYNECARLNNTTIPAKLTEKARAFAAQYALGRLLMSVQLQPSNLLAEGTGILVAACLRGLLTLEQAFNLLAQLEHGNISGDISTRSEIVSPAWKCPLVTPQGILRSSAQVTTLQLAALVQASTNLNASACKEIAAPGVYLHLGGSLSMREQLEIADEPQIWISANKQQAPVSGLLEAIGKLYVTGVRLNSLPLLPKGLRRVPLPTYPFDYGTYKAPLPQDKEENQPSTSGSGLLRVVKLPPLPQEKRQSVHTALLNEFTKFAS